MRSMSTVRKMMALVFVLCMMAAPAFAADPIRIGRLRPWPRSWRIDATPTGRVVPPGPHLDGWERAMQTLYAFGLAVVLGLSATVAQAGDADYAVAPADIKTQLTVTCSMPPAAVTPRCWPSSSAVVMTSIVPMARAIPR